MADLDDLDLKSITTIDSDDALEVLRQIRLSRRTPTRNTSPAKEKAIKKQAVKNVDADQAQALLNILTGGTPQ